MEIWSVSDTAIVVGAIEEVVVRDGSTAELMKRDEDEEKVSVIERFSDALEVMTELVDIAAVEDSCCADDIGVMGVKEETEVVAMSEVVAKTEVVARSGVAKTEVVARSGVVKTEVVARSGVVKTEVVARSGVASSEEIEVVDDTTLWAAEDDVTPIDEVINVELSKAELDGANKLEVAITEGLTAGVELAISATAEEVSVAREGDSVKDVEGCRGGRLAIKIVVSAKGSLAG